MQVVNSVTVSGLLHHTRVDKKNERYFPFSIKQESPWSDGTIRKDFITARAFTPSIQEELKAMPEGTQIKVTGNLHSSQGSGEMYLYAQAVQKL